MATPITFAGNLTGEPESGTSPNGVDWTRMTVAHNDRYKDQDGQWTDGPTTFYRVTCFRNTALNVARSQFKKGDRLIVSGALTVRGYIDKDGLRQRSHDVAADLVGPDLTFVPVILNPQDAPLPEEPNEHI